MKLIALFFCFLDQATILRPIPGDHQQYLPDQSDLPMCHQVVQVSSRIFLFKLHSGPECQKKSRKFGFTSFFMHKKFVKSIFTAKIQFLCSKIKSNLHHLTYYYVISRKNAQTGPISLASTQNLATIDIGLKVLRSVYLILLVFYIHKSPM